MQKVIKGGGEQMELSKLTGEQVLQSQQEDFIHRLRSIHCEYPEYPTDLSTLHYFEPYSAYSSCERIKIFLNSNQESQIDWFCYEMTNKFSRLYADDFVFYPDIFVNHKIGKLGEEAARIFLGNLVRDVDYELYQGGDGGTDLFMAANPNIKIQVKTTPLVRLTRKQLCEDKNEINENDFACAVSEDKTFGYNSIDFAKWIVNYPEKQKNKIVICILLLNPVIGEQIEDAKEGYDFVIAGFKPTESIKSCPAKMVIQELLYCGGIRSYLLSRNFT